MTKTQRLVKELKRQIVRLQKQAQPIYDKIHAFQRRCRHGRIRVSHQYNGYQVTVVCHNCEKVLQIVSGSVGKHVPEGVHRAADFKETLVL